MLSSVHAKVTHKIILGEMVVYSVHMCFEGLLWQQWTVDCVHWQTMKQMHWPYFMFHYNSLRWICNWKQQGHWIFDWAHLVGIGIVGCLGVDILCFRLWFSTVSNMETLTGWLAPFMAPLHGFIFDVLCKGRAERTLTEHCPVSCCDRMVVDLETPSWWWSSWIQHVLIDVTWMPVRRVNGEHWCGAFWSFETRQNIDCSRFLSLKAGLPGKDDSLGGLFWMLQRYSF